MSLGGLTLAVMSDTALGSGSVLGMLPQSCHMKLKDTDVSHGGRDASAGLRRRYPPEVRVLEDVLVLQELHVVVPDPLKGAAASGYESPALNRHKETDKPPAGRETRRSGRPSRCPPPAPLACRTACRRCGSARAGDGVSTLAAPVLKGTAAASHLLKGEIHELVCDRVVGFGLEDKTKRVNAEL